MEAIKQYKLPEGFPIIVIYSSKQKQQPVADLEECAMYTIQLFKDHVYNILHDNRHKKTNNNLHKILQSRDIYTRICIL